MKFKSYLQEKAEAEAKKMLKTGEITRPLPFRGGAKSVLVSLDPEAILALDYFELEGKIFYIGQKKNK